MRDFPHSSRPALGPAQPPLKWVPGLFTAVKWPGRGFDHQPPFSAEVEEGFHGLLQVNCIFNLHFYMSV